MTRGIGGIVLAGGDATRLPNKALLPTRHGGVIIESGLKLLRRSNASDVVVVQAPNRLIERVLHMKGWTDLSFTEQAGANGVANAIRVGFAALPEEVHTAAVVFCDNIYHNCEAVPFTMANDAPVVSTRRVAYPACASLDWWDSTREQWAYRDTSTQDKDCIAGWYVMTREHAAQARDDESSVMFLNRIGARPVKMNEGWWDVGTVESYLDYVTS